MPNSNDIKNPVETSENELKEQFSPVFSFAQRMDVLSKEGKLEYPKYRTLSEEQTRSYIKASELPDVQRKSMKLDLARAAENTAGQNAKNAVVVYMANMMSGVGTEAALGNILVTEDYSPVIGSAAEAFVGGKVAQAVGGGALKQAAAFGLGATGAGAFLSAVSPTELGRGDVFTATPQEHFESFYKKPLEDLEKDWKSEKISYDEYQQRKQELSSKFNEYVEQYNKKQNITQEGQLEKALKEHGYTDEQIERLKKPTAVQSLGLKLTQAAVDKAEYKASVMPQVDADSYAARFATAPLSAGEYLITGLGVAKIARTAVKSAKMPKDRWGRKSAEFTIKKGTKYEDVVDRYAGMVGNKIGSAAATAQMSADIMGQGAMESIQKYIEDTGDTELINYKGDIRKVALDAFGTHMSNVIEKLGFNKFVRNPRAIKKWGEWGNGFVQEFTQGEINDVTEFVKGNQTAMDVINNIPYNVIDGVAGGWTQGTIGTAYFNYQHNKNVNDLVDVVMAQKPNKTEQEVRQFAENQVKAIENEVSVDVVKEIVDFTDATQYQGKIYENIRNNVKKAIDYQMDIMKDTDEGSEFENLTEDELAQYVEQVAHDETDKVVIESLEQGTPLSESPRLKGITIAGTYYLEGEDYAKQNKKQAEATRKQLLDAVYQKKEQADTTKLDEKSAKEVAQGVESTVKEQGLEFQETEPMEDKDLIVQHGTTLSKLNDALDLGGMPVPSLAVMKADQSSKQYGEITFIGGQDLVQGEPVYTSDIYSARRIRPYLEINDKGMKYLKNLVGGRVYFLQANIPDLLGTGSGDDLMMHLYLLEKGKRNDPENTLTRQGADFTQEYSKMSDEEQKEYAQWVKDFESNYFDKKIFGGYTPSGRKKTLDYNMENIVKIMAKKPTAGSEAGFGTSPHALKGIWAKPLKTIDAIRKNKDKLVSEEEYKEVDSQFWDSFNQLTDLLRTEELVKNLPYSYDEHIVATLMEIKKNTDIKSLLEQNYMNATDEAVQAVKDFKAFAESVPAKYFEAKPKRAVDFSEFNAVLLPSDARYDSVAQKLAELGVKQVLRYNTDEERQAQIQTLKPIMFQTQKQSRKGGAYDPRTRSITLGSGANVTTFPHEFAHYWIEKNFKWARSGKASQEWMRQWSAVEKWLGIDPDDKYLDKAASEKFARAYERFLGEEEVPLVLKKSLGDFRDFVLDHYDFELDEAKGLTDKFGRPIKLNDDVKNWFKKSIYETYSDPVESEVVVERLRKDAEDNKEIKQADQENETIRENVKNSESFKTADAETNLMDVQKSAGISNEQIIGKREIGGGEQKESKGKIAEQLGGRTYESTSWEIQEQMVEDYLKTVSLDQALEDLDNETYPEKIDPNFLRSALTEKLLDAGREMEATALIEETADDFSDAAQRLQAARTLNTPFTNAIQTLNIAKAEQLARAKFGNKKTAVADLDAAMNRLVAKYEKDFLNAQTDEEREMVYAALQDEAVRTIGSLNKDESSKLDFQTIEDKEERKQAREIRKQQKRRASIKAYRGKAKRALKQALGLEPTRQQVREIRKRAVKVQKAIADFRKDVRQNKTSAIDPIKVLEAQNELNNYMNSQLPTRYLGTFADAANSYMMANMLWNPATNVFNLESTWVQMIPHLVALAINNGTFGTISAREKAKIIKSAIITQIKTGYNIFSLRDFFDNKTIWAEKFYEAQSVLGKGIRVPLTALGLMDTMNKGVVFLQAADSMATKQAREEGKKNGWAAEQVKQRAKELFYQALNTDPRTITIDGLKIRKAAVQEGEEATFTQNTRTAQIVNKVRKALNFGGKTGLGNVIMPFTTTIANIAEDTVVNYSLGFVKNTPKAVKAIATSFDKTATAEMKKEAWKEVLPETKNAIKNVIGILILLSFALGGDDDDYVLGYDRQTAKDKDIRTNRNAPYGYAVRLGDKWVDLDLFGIGSQYAKMYMIARRGNFEPDAWTNAIVSSVDLLPGVGELQSMYDTFTDVSKAKGEWEGVAELASDKIEELSVRIIPMSAAFGQIASHIDKSKRETWNNWYDKMKAKIPGFREKLPERTSTQTGEVIPQTDSWGNYATGSRIKDYIEPTGADEVRYEFAETGKPLSYREGNSKLKELGKDTVAYKKAVNRVRKDFTKKLENISDNPEYQRLDIDQKRKVVNELHKEALTDVKVDLGLEKPKKQKQPKKRKNRLKKNRVNGNVNQGA